MTARLVPLVLGASLVVTACTSGQQEAAPSRLTVRASASVTHNGITYMQAFRGHSAIATRADGKKFTGVFGVQGTAVLDLPPGQYRVTTSIADVCYPLPIMIPARSAEVTLTCGLP